MTCCVNLIVLHCYRVSASLGPTKSNSQHTEQYGCVLQNIKACPDLFGVLLVLFLHLELFLLLTSCKQDNRTIPSLGAACVSKRECNICG